MKVQVEVPIQASKEAIWQVITDIENSPQHISGIEEVEVHNHPGDKLVGLKWTETRTLFGKTATETMWVTEATKNEYYRTRAESHGAIYNSTLRIDERNGQNYLSMELHGEPQTFGAKIMGAIFGFMFKNATRKALMQDLQDIKKVAESKDQKKATPS